MVRLALCLAVVAVWCVLGRQDASAQATKKLEGNTAASPQQKSWDQVDQINREADRTRARHSQAQKSGGITKGYTGGYVVKKSYPAKKSPKMKSAQRKPKPLPKTKKK